MSAAIVPVHSIERRLRGGSQPLLVRAAGDDVYVAKCAGNPQGNRTLINEWIVTRLLKLLKLCAPEVHPLQIETGLPGGDLLQFKMGQRTLPVHTGLHLGSRCPVDPAQAAIFDFLPRALLPKVVNLPDLIGAFAVDKWVGQTDSRQAIFTRERSLNRGAEFRAHLVDHGQSFAGSRWEFFDSPLQGLYYDRSIYARPNVEADCQQTVDRIRLLTDEDLHSASPDIPEEWFKAGDRERLNSLLETLSKRREALPGLVSRSLRELRKGFCGIPQALVGLLLLLSVLICISVPQFFDPSVRAVAVEVSANRSASFAQAAVGRPLLLTANAYDLQEPFFIAELVDGYGTRMWMGYALGKNGRIQTTLPPVTETGVYFFRLYARDVDGAPNELLREYVILVR